MTAIDSSLNSSRHVIRVRFADTDLMGVVHHASYLTYFEAGRVEFMRRRGVCYAEWVGCGVHLPIVDIGLRYRRPARFDQRLVVTTWLDQLKAYSLRFVYRINDFDAPDTSHLVEGHTRLACTDDTGRLAAIPSDITVRLAQPESLCRPVDQV